MAFLLGRNALTLILQCRITEIVQGESCVRPMQAIHVAVRFRPGSGTLFMVFIAFLQNNDGAPFIDNDDGNTVIKYIRFLRIL